MSLSLSVGPTRYFSIDADHDLTGGTLLFSLDKLTWPATGTFIASPGLLLTGAFPPAEAGLTRFWWSLLLGPGQPIVPPVGRVTVYGQLNGQSIYDWRLDVRN